MPRMSRCCFEYRTKGVHSDYCHIRLYWKQPGPLDPPVKLPAAKKKRKAK